MAPPEAPSEVTVRVKIPPGHLQGTNEEVFTLGSLSTALTVAALRARIQTLVPTNPPPTSQRILYGGRALIDDEQSLADALNTRRDPTQTEYVMHLLVRNGGTDSTVRAGSGLVGQPIATNDSSQTIAAMLAQSQAMLHNQHVPITSPPPAMPTNDAIRSDGSGPQLAGPDSSGISQDGATSTPTANAQPHRHHHHHHHHPQPHFHQGPHFHPHVPQVPFQRPPSAHSPFPRPPSVNGVHISGTGPDGQHFAIHQQTFSTAALPNHQQQPFQAMLPGGLPLGFPPLGMPLPGMPLPGMPQMMPPAGQSPSGQPPVFTALDRARENMAEMRRMLETMRDDNTNSEERNTRVRDIEQRMQAVNDYIDPLRLGSRIPSNRPQSVPARTPSSDTPNTTPGPQQAVPPALASLQPAFPGLVYGLNQLSRQHPTHQQPDQTTVYLLSTPQGPHALLFSPQHGSFSGSLDNPQYTTQGPLSTLAVNNAQVPTPTQQAPNAAGPQNEQPGPGGPAQAEPLAMLQPILGHAWLLVRVLIFAYFLMGADMGWRRPLGLALIGLGFWLIRLGLFGPNGIVRRWWDGVVHVEDVRERLRRLGLLDPQANAAPVVEAPVNANENAANLAQAPRPFPTPEELAQRLLRERRQNAPLQRLRDHIRPVERALALLVASLWPGVGEGYVQALDRAREEEELARRLLERQQEEATQAQQVTTEAEKQPEISNAEDITDDKTASDAVAQPAEASASGEKRD